MGKGLGLWGLISGLPRIVNPSRASRFGEVEGNDHLEKRSPICQVNSTYRRTHHKISWNSTVPA